MGMVDKITRHSLPVCSICIANYNGMGTLGAAIDSVLAQVDSVPFEIIVHDDASTDESVEFVRKHYPDIRLIVSSENVGFCRSNNRMADKSNGEYILLLNNDAELFPDALATLYAYSRESGTDGILGLPQYQTDTRERLDYGYLLDPFLNTVPNLDPTRRTSPW